LKSETDCVWGEFSGFEGSGIGEGLRIIESHWSESLEGLRFGGF